MPELPEVETVRLGLLPVLEGHVFTKVETRRGDLRVPFPKDFAKRLTGRRVLRLWRRAKYILVELDDGQTLVVHLGMSGRFAVHAKGQSGPVGQFFHTAAPPGKHDHVVMETDAPARLVFTDHRRFGLMTLIETVHVADDKLFRGLGVEPLSDDFDAVYLSLALKGKKTPIKSALLDQRVIAGLGNIYVCEALHRTRISPKRQAAKIPAAAITPLLRAIKAVLREAIKAGGSSLRDYKKADGELGYFQHHFAVYDREGEPCHRKDGGTIKRIVQAGRSTFYCSKCQK
ncbi:MAG: bifunctional DNA-formamidopyrimidine glycosylase/DNA-(apurinic or apyrimidinic site) lyase [Alphaproteobacteria bacterium]|nr:bifunctional DNA-formamidopyrimidine glycosylase/DNA-(apurinic or apyrimidinic site) lyase [Alphaproteobacteria bacterium]MDE2112299.1 bifunctional DNA-formamidopyrimidine glycosylase/DNA-(apurinic or apyrimidinic site) lyase [Alphaproteobacteria bacterium]MDE2494303.1 bifunctional DNA-formamidopyrimidine glycosylase/DNA-(apurinic or apyrimidinic site) lyase [Alphaproteobacteria bacterium]